MRSFTVNDQPFYSLLGAKLRQHSPKLLTFLILLFSVTPTYLPGYSTVRPYITLIPIFYWAVYRPYDFSVVSAFIIGFFLDLLDGTPLGINTLIFTLFYLIVETQRRYLIGKSFCFVWFGFALFSFGAYFFKWLFVSINYAAFTPAITAFISYILLLLCYPVVSWPCAKLHVYLLDKEK
ncbi:MAG: rod shape-determining protein MreD [Alphaproteobacteria bacterium]|nr:rod shape-determining protein MreD [Alphaproteobacteria bacterium]